MPQSAHAIADPDFAAAIARFVEHERGDVAQTVDELERASPFRQEPVLDSLRSTDDS